MKISKSYRLSPRTVAAIAQLKALYPSWTETDLVEAALEDFARREKEYHERSECMRRSDPGLRSADD